MLVGEPAALRPRKGKPVARPGRKAEGQSISAGSLVAEGMLVRWFDLGIAGQLITSGCASGSYAAQAAPRADGCEVQHVFVGLPDGAKQAADEFLIGGAPRGPGNESSFERGQS